MKETLVVKGAVFATILLICYVKIPSLQPGIKMTQNQHTIFSDRPSETEASAGNTSVVNFLKIQMLPMYVVEAAIKIYQEPQM